MIIDKTNFYDFLNEDKDILKSVMDNLPKEETLFLKTYFESAQNPGETAIFMTLCYKLGRLMTTKLREEAHVN